MFGQNYSKCTKELKSASVSNDLLKAKNIGHAEKKKLKIALLTEPDFMVKLMFEGWKLCFANICAPVTWVKYLIEFDSSLFPYIVDWEVFVLSPTNIK